MIKIALGSKSRQKEVAVQNACDGLSIEYQLKTFKTRSRQNAQPIGLVQIFQGAFTQARATKAKAPESISLGIENGLVIFEAEPQIALDIAVVVALSPEGNLYVTNTVGVPFPLKYVTAAENRGFKKHTAGSAISKALGGDPTDPHSTITNGFINRSALLTDAIMLALSQLLNGKSLS